MNTKAFQAAYKKAGENYITLGEVEGLSEGLGRGAEYKVLSDYWERIITFFDEGDNHSALEWQIKRFEKEIEETEIIDEFSSEKYGKMEAEKVAAEFARKFKGGIDVQGFGVVEFNEDRVNEAFNYLNTPEEFAAMFAIPKILKKGKVIGAHKNHKGRGYSTVTIGGKIMINGYPVIVGALVKKTNALKYTVHRVLTPKGVVILEKNKTEVTPSVRLSVSSMPATDITSVNNNIYKINKNSQEKTSEILQDDENIPSIRREPSEKTEKTATAEEIAAAKERSAAAYPNDAAPSTGEEPVPGKYVQDVQTYSASDNNIREEEEISQEISEENIEYTDRRAVTKYKSFDSYTLNYKLNNRMELEENEKAWSEELSGALSRLPDYKGVTYRRLTFDGEGKEAYDRFIAAHVI